MSLDAIVSDDEDYPLRVVEIGLRAHERMVSLVEEYRLPLLSRVKSYWEDALFTREELGDLLKELAALKSTTQCVGDVEKLVDSLADLVVFASDSGRPLEFAAD